MRANSGKRLIAVLCVIAAGGCEATPATRLIDPFGLIFSGETPVRIGINRVHIPLPPFFPQAPWGALQIGLAEAIQQPVQFEALNPLQIQHHLRSGRLAFALVNAVDYIVILEFGGSDQAPAGMMRLTFRELQAGETLTKALRDELVREIIATNRKHPARTVRA